MIEFDTKQTKQRQKPSFLNKSVKNADFYKYILKKIMTTHECLEYISVAPLREKERVKDFFIFMNVLSFKQVESDYGKKVFRE